MESPPPSATLSIARGPLPPGIRNELRLSTALYKILDTAKTQPLTLGMIIATTQERAFGVLMAFLCLPFLLPISIPGTSIPFGISLMVVGIQLACGKNRPWLPQRMRNWNLPHTLTTKIIAGLARVFRPLEKIVWPRLLIMQNPAAMVLIGIALAIDGIFLSLPWPPFIPFSNQIPAWIAMVKIIGLTEEDGVSLIVGLLLTAGIVIGITVAIILGWDSALAWWQGHHAATMPAP